MFVCAKEKQNDGDAFNLALNYRFLGPTAWYRRFIANYADITHPATELLRKSEKENKESTTATSITGRKHQRALSSP